MVAVSHIAVGRGLIGKAVLSDIEAVLTEYGFRTKIALPSADLIYSYMQRDKKKANGKLKFVLPVAIGDVVEAQDVTESEIKEAICYINNADL